MEPYLINEPSQGGAKRGKNMARRRRRSRRNAPKRNAKGQFVKGAGASTAPRKRRVRKYKRRIRPLKHRHLHKPHRVKLSSGRYRRQHWVRAHWSNPPIMGQVTDHLIGAGIVLGTLFAVGFLNRQAQRLPIPQFLGKWTDLAVKLGVALGSVWAIRALSRRRMLPISESNARMAQHLAFVPLGMALVNEFVPTVGAQISLAQDDEDEEMGAGLRGTFPQDLGMPAGKRLSDYCISADLQAELEADAESSSY